MRCADNGLVNIESPFDVSTTAERFEKILKSNGMTVFKRIEHSKGAEQVGQELRPTILIIFGNPKVGTPLMNCEQSVAIDLPQKALIWEDEEGQVWLSYNDPSYLAKRHKIKNCDQILNKMEQALENFAEKATAK